jgi:hypothetical protein
MNIYYLKVKEPFVKNGFSQEVIENYNVLQEIYLTIENSKFMNLLFCYETTFFEINYSKIKNRMNILKEELIMETCHPYIVNKSLLKYNYLDC